MRSRQLRAAAPAVTVMNPSRSSVAGGMLAGAKARTEIASRRGIELTTAAVGGMFGFFFHPGPVRSFEDAKKSHGARFRRFFSAMLDRGIYLAPSAFEAGFVSLAHGPAALAETLEAADQALKLAARVR
jgi:glutamate-1-semialdehyde aminotransferase